jgi:hypothetical protein
VQARFEVKVQDLPAAIDKSTYMNNWADCAFKYTQHQSYHLRATWWKYLAANSKL